MEEEIESRQIGEGIEYNYDSYDVGVIFDELVNCENVPEYLK